MARTGKACLEFLGIQRPSLVVLNGLAPSIDRMELLWEIKRRVPGTPVIMLSSKDGLFDKARGRIVGSEQYLTKPFTKDELLGAIKRHVKRENA